uniref:Uncharacterized protein n=1 Tax=Romanomermis culicivorax TaxID=13658 RepID=A0A915KGR1_ROMCU
MQLVQTTMMIPLMTLLMIPLTTPSTSLSKTPDMTPSMIQQFLLSKENVLGIIIEGQFMNIVFTSTMDDTRALPEFGMILARYDTLGNHALRIQRLIIENVHCNASLGYQMIVKGDGKGLELISLYKAGNN